MGIDAILEKLKILADPDTRAGMGRFGIDPDKALGVRIPHLRLLAKEIGKDHDLARRLWRIDMRETRILAALVDEPDKVDEMQMEAWVAAFWDWEVCDQCCMNLFEKTPFAWVKALEWSARSEEFVKRAGFVLMARLAVSDKRTADPAFEAFLPIIEREADDDRNMVKKAVNWALRQIGKRNLSLHRLSMAAAERIRSRGTRAAKWIAADALREFRDEKILARLRARTGKNFDAKE
jgi:3-methyladenine DNA glycosylase AlkD